MNLGTLYLQFDGNSLFTVQDMVGVRDNVVGQSKYVIMAGFIEFLKRLEQIFIWWNGYEKHAEAQCAFF